MVKYISIHQSMINDIIVLVRDSSKKTSDGKKEKRDMGLMTWCVGCGTLETPGK